LPAVAVSDFDAAALSPPAARAGNGPAKQTRSPAATIKAERPLALIIIGNLPNLPAPDREKRPCRVSAARQKKGIFGQHRAKAGQCIAARGIFRRRIFEKTGSEGIGYGCERRQSML